VEPFNIIKNFNAYNQGRICGRGASDTATPDGKAQGDRKLIILNETKFGYLCSTNFKLLSQIKVNSICGLRYFEVHKFC